MNYKSVKIPECVHTELIILSRETGIPIHKLLSEICYRAFPNLQIRKLPDVWQPAPKDYREQATRFYDVLEYWRDTIFKYDTTRDSFRGSSETLMMEWAFLEPVEEEGGMNGIVFNWMFDPKIYNVHLRQLCKFPELGISYNGLSDQYYITKP